MKKIYMILAAITLLSMSLNAQIAATKKVAQTQQTAPTGKKVDMQLGVAKMALNPTSHRAPARATETTTYSYTLPNSNAFSTAGGTAALGDVNWTYSAFTYKGWENARGLQIGSRNSPTSTFTLSTSEIPGTITSITVGANAYSASATISITVGGQAFGTTQNLSSSTSAATNTFTGTASGDIVITMRNATNGRAMYFKSISVTYETESGVETTDLTVCDGNYFAQYLPFLGYYHDEAQHNQMIYPASMLASMVGKTIKSMTFYPTSGSVTWSNGTTESASGINFRNGSVRFKLACISSGSSFDADNPSFVNATLTEVKTVNMPSTANTSATTWLIRFDQDFVYTGGDLLIDVTNPTTGDWGLTFFTVDDTGSNYYGYHTSGAGSAALNYLPKVTFTYEGDPNPVHDLSIALSAPATAGAGTIVNVTATVTNNGDLAENGYTVTVSDGTNIVNITAQEELGIGETATFTVQFATSANAGGSTVNYTATVACTDDADATNNSATASTSLLACPPPINVAATPGNNHNATMTWDAPNIPSVLSTTTWGFEEDTQNNTDTSLPAGWTTIDADGDTYAWYHLTGDNFKNHTGIGHLTSASYQGGTVLYPDNWLISPEITLGGTLTFWACGQDNSDYAENLAVYVYQGSYSSGTSGFIKVGADVTTTASMAEYTFDLSQYSGQGRIAIRHYNCSNMFRLNIDDITNQVSITGEQPTSYNIYLDGQLVGNVPSSTFSYDFSNLSDGQHTCAVSAVYSYGESVAVPVTFTISSQPQTPAPTIAISSQTDDEVTITATGNGTVILNIPGYPQATGNGSASITVPRHMADYVVTATATAQASGELVSTTTTQNITIPGTGLGDWIEMTGTYTNPNDLLSFKVKVGNDTTDIMMIDQFLESTVFNDHPSSYTYVLKEQKIINGVDSTMTSNPAVIPVYKTNSTMRGLYTEAQVLADDYADAENRLTANAVNIEMDYNVVPDNNVLYYSLYRGGIQEETPAIDEQHRISQLQKFEDKVGDNVIYYLTENHPTGILPRYDHEDNIGSQIVERLDVDYVTGETGDQMSYVPVIWTFGLYTARGDGKNNSYGSDIKYNELGGVDVNSQIIVNWTDNNKMDYNGNDYYVVAPVITLDAVAPEVVEGNDGDAYEYVPYMYRVWCTYTDAHNFGHLVNPDGTHYSLVETGLIDAPFLIGEVEADTLTDPTHVVIGRDLGHVSPQTQWSFAVSKEAVNNGDIEFVVRYYYKKVVTDADPTAQPSGMRGNRDSGADYAIYETRTSSSDIVTGVNELWNGYGKVVLSRTYVNAQGMQSDKPFDGLNIVVTRFSDGTTTTTKVVR